MAQSHSQNSALSSTAHSCRLLNMIINKLFLGNGTILMLHITPNHKLHKASFQVTYNVAVCTVGTLSSSNNARLKDPIGLEMSRTDRIQVLQNTKFSK